MEILKKVVCWGIVLEEFSLKLKVMKFEVTPFDQF